MEERFDNEDEGLGVPARKCLAVGPSAVSPLPAQANAAEDAAPVPNAADAPSHRELHELQKRHTRQFVNSVLASRNTDHIDALGFGLFADAVKKEEERNTIDIPCEVVEPAKELPPASEPPSHNPHQR